MRILQTRINMFDASKLLAFISDVSSQTTSTARCNECFTNGVACLDEQNFSVCISGTPINIRTSCPTGAVCTAEEDICVATAQGGTPVCFVNRCGQCLSAEKNFACLDENIYALCYDGETPDTSSMNYCPLGNVCDLTNTNICSPTQSATPSCILDTTTTVTTETTTDATTSTSTDTTTASSSTLTTTDTTIETTTDLTTASSTETTTTATTETTTETTTGSSSDITTDSTTDSTTDTTTSTSSDTTTSSSSTHTTTTGTTTDLTTASSTETTTAATTESTTDTKTGTTTDITTVTTTVTTTPSTTPATTDTTTQTTQAPKDPNTFCTEIGRSGNFRADGDKTCKKYIYCYGLSGQFLGWEYTCANYFNAATGKCQTERPADC
ncbi:unnamed protein product [Ceratitis capitata]|uniref:(Mediterranean fruit fly) hypothetical protein n=1 Tax=Ceratitis capitata TaxID=7213 RepID=A0A811V6F6_CERCA|nr:unnamed protein product [Ceratitis capitata]